MVTLLHLVRLWRALWQDRQGNLMVMMAVAAIPLTFAIGFGVDYARAQRFQTKLNAAADAAVLAAVVPQMISQSDATAQSAAQQMFDSQVSGLTGLTITSRVVNITSTSSSSLGTLRTVTLTYRAASTNSFSRILGANTLAITGSAQASASQPPSINFYIALDTSPSMLLPTTSTGIANLTGGAIWRGEQFWYGRVDGCAFACHSNNMQQWNAGTYVVDRNNAMIFLNSGGNASSLPFYRVTCGGAVSDDSGASLGTNASLLNSSNNAVPTNCNYTSSQNQIYNQTSNPIYLRYLPNGKSNTNSNYVSKTVSYPDTWWLARNYDQVNPGYDPITLRTDAEGDAAAGVIQYAYNVQQQYANATVPPVYKMQFYTFNVGNPAVLSTSPFGTMTNVATLRSQTFPDLGAQAPMLAATSYWTTMSVYTGNADTHITTMLNWMQSNLPASGIGTPSAPQNVLLIVTDGALDSPTEGTSQLTANNISQCNAIKAAGTRIAILYTEYLPATINYTGKPSFNSFAANNVPYIAQQLQACASQNADGTYLMQTVSTDGDVTAALNTLFAMTVQSAKLLK